MKSNLFYKLLSILCWVVTALTVSLEIYMVLLMKHFPEIESFRKNTLLILPLPLLWLAASIWFTVQARKGKTKK